MNTLIVGCGYLGHRVGWLLSARGERVIGTTRSPDQAWRLEALGIEPAVVDVLDTASVAHLPRAERVFYGVGYDRSSGVPMRSVAVDGLRRVLEHFSGVADRFVYASSTGVYGQDDGEWVDEDSTVSPRSESGQVVLEAEQLVRALVPGSIILRFSGLYGPGRLPRRTALVRAEPISGDPSKYINLIHIDDAAAATVAALDRGVPGRTYIISDDRPVERRIYYDLVAEHLRAPAPRFNAPEPGTAKAGRDESNKRVSNLRMKEELGVVLSYRDITTGIPAALYQESESS